MSQSMDGLNQLFSVCTQVHFTICVSTELLNQEKGHFYKFQMWDKNVTSHLFVTFYKIDETKGPQLQQT